MGRPWVLLFPLAAAPVACSAILQIESVSYSSPDAAGADAQGGETGDGPSDGAAGGATKLVFVSRGTLLPGVGFKASATTRCQTEGSAVKPGSTFVAWFSLHSLAIDDLSNEGSWGLPGGGEVVFPTRKAITSGVLLHVIDQHADGATVPSSTNAWTNTDADGSEITTGSQTTCDSFSTQNGALTGAAGHPASSLDGQWTHALELGCDTPANVICFEK